MSTPESCHCLGGCVRVCRRTVTTRQWPGQWQGPLQDHRSLSVTKGETEWWWPDVGRR